MLLLGMKVNVMTDHHSLTYLLCQRTLSRRQARWLEHLADFHLDFQYIRGEDNTVADTLSRKEQVDTDDVVVSALTHLSSVVSEELCKSVKAAYEGDKFCQSLISSSPYIKIASAMGGYWFSTAGWSYHGCPT